VPGSIFISLIPIFSTNAAVDSSIKTDAPFFYKQTVLKVVPNVYMKKKIKPLLAESLFVSPETTEG
jgi:hypothetical protein